MKRQTADSLIRGMTVTIKLTNGETVMGDVVYVDNIGIAIAIKVKANMSRTATLYTWHSIDAIRYANYFNDKFEYVDMAGDKIEGGI